MVRRWEWAAASRLSFGASLFLTSTAGAAALDAEQADRLRIQGHLAGVEQRLRQAPVDALAPAARLSRARLLDELHDYWQAGVFPRNSGHAGQRRPYFIDDENRPCAVGALIIRSGSAALAQRIDRTFHTDYVPEMQDAELLSWAASHGFSVAELALIQPTYCNCDGWDGGFGPGGAGGADGADYYQPVCGNDGLTYWNQCIAELCGGVTIVGEGACERPPPCELCGTGTREAVVSECTNDVPIGICNGIDSQPDIIPVNDAVAAHWLEMQNADCENPDYTKPMMEVDSIEGWQPSWPVQEQWSCSTEGSSGAGGVGGEPTSSDAGNSGEAGSPAAEGGAPTGGSSSSPAAGSGPTNPAAGAPAQTEPSGGCSCSAPAKKRGAGATLSLLLIGLAGLRRKRRRHARQG